MTALGPAWNPDRLLFHHRGAGPTTHLEQCVRGADFAFSSGCLGIELPASLLDERLPPQELDLEILRRVVHKELIRGRGNVGQTARALGMSKRSFQRRLSEQGISYRQFLLDLRMDLASRYLAASESSIGSIAVHLGYRHHSDFSRVFKSHFGRTPIEHRQQGSHSL